MMSALPHGWERPGHRPSQACLSTRGVVVVTLTTDAEDRVTTAVWRRQ